jgi:hypothetical protein
MSKSAIAILLLGLLASLQYWRGRRLNLTLIRGLARQMEEALSPVEKEYTWIGGYAGAIAHYNLENEEYPEIKVTISLLPHHSLLYFPVSILLGRRDRMYLLIYSQRKLAGKAHVKPGKKAKLPHNISCLHRDQVVIRGEVVHRYYDSEEEAKFLTSILSCLKSPSSVEHLAANVEENAYYASVRISRGDLAELFNCFLSPPHTGRDPFRGQKRQY